MKNWQNINPVAKDYNQDVTELQYAALNII